MIEDAEYVLLRQKNHPIYKHPVDGDQIVMPRGSITSPRFSKWIKCQLKQRERKKLLIG